MKVLGTVGSRHYLVEMTPEELGRLSGGDYEWRTNDDAIGKRFDIVPTWQLLKDLESRRAELPHIANKLRALADLLAPITCEIPSEEKS